MEQCTEKFAFVDTFMTGKSAPLVQRGVLCGKNPGHTRKGRGSWTCPLLLLWKRNGRSGEISLAESVVVTCCAAPDRDMARKTEVMENKKVSESQQD